MLLCAITSRLLLADPEIARTENLVALAAQWAAAELDFIQIREKDLTDDGLLQLSMRIVQAVRDTGSLTSVLINGIPSIACSIALQSGADGVHISGGLDALQLATAVKQIRNDWKFQDKPGSDPTISVSCHSVADILAARGAGASMALFAPVFEKVLPGGPSVGGKGLEFLAQACRAANQPGSHPEIPVLALGGVTLENAAQCAAAGAAGVAAIRLFLDSGDGEDWRGLLP
jgi:thiamine-phosphate pyrophosphorylase